MTRTRAPAPWSTESAATQHSTIHSGSAPSQDTNITARGSVPCYILLLQLLLCFKFLTKYWPIRAKCYLNDNELTNQSSVSDDDYCLKACSHCPLVTASQLLCLCLSNLQTITDHQTPTTRQTSLDQAEHTEWVFQVVIKYADKIVTDGSDHTESGVMRYPQTGFTDIEYQSAECFMLVGHDDADAGQTAIFRQDTLTITLDTDKDSFMLKILQ